MNDQLTIDVPRVVKHSRSIEREAKGVEVAGRQLEGLDSIAFGRSGPALGELLERCSAALIARGASAGEAGRSVREFAEAVMRQDAGAIRP